MKNHSTETALLRVKKDILMNMNKGQVTLLVLLDLSSAFDTVDHGSLLKCLHSRFGVSGKVLEWFASYLYDRIQRVMINRNQSDSFFLQYGVPQGSCLGPICLLPTLQSFLRSGVVICLMFIATQTIHSCTYRLHQIHIKVMLRQLLECSRA